MLPSTDIYIPLSITVAPDGSYQDSKGRSAGHRGGGGQPRHRRINQHETLLHHHPDAPPARRRSVPLYLLRDRIFPSVSYEVDDELGGNIFPSLILSVATTDTLIVQPSQRPVVGNPKSHIFIQVTSPRPNSRLRIEVAETPFFKRSVSEFILPEEGKTYTVYPDILWNFSALRNNRQAVPVNVSVEARLNEGRPARRTRTFSVRSINECLIGYYDKRNRFHNTGVLFAAYVNEDSPLIDQILREALNTRIVNRFLGYQSKRADYVDKQVYALWNVLQRRNFKYSSISNSSLSSNVVYAQRVRTLEDALASSQINCVDGSVLFASVLRAINIDPILVRLPRPHVRRLLHRPQPHPCAVLGNHHDRRH